METNTPRIRYLITINKDNIVSHSSYDTKLNTLKWQSFWNKDEWNLSTEYKEFHEVFKSVRYPAIRFEVPEHLHNHPNLQTVEEVKQPFPEQFI